MTAKNSPVVGELSLWSQADAVVIAKAINSISTLEVLELTDLADECLHGRDDSVLAVMLSNKPTLRKLTVSALPAWQLQMFGRTIHGSVTDASLARIVDKVGSTVQSLEFEANLALRLKDWKRFCVDARICDHWLSLVSSRQQNE